MLLVSGGAHVGEGEDRDRAAGNGGSTRDDTLAPEPLQRVADL